MTPPSSPSIFLTLFGVPSFNVVEDEDPPASKQHQQQGEKGYRVQMRENLSVILTCYSTMINSDLKKKKRKLIFLPYLREIFGNFTLMLLKMRTLQPQNSINIRVNKVVGIGKKSMRQKRIVGCHLVPHYVTHTVQSRAEASLNQ